MNPLQKMTGSVAPFRNVAAATAAAGYAPGYQSIINIANRPGAAAGGGGGGGAGAARTAAAAPPPDPLAAVRAGFNAQKGNIYGTAREAAANAGIGINSSIIDFVNSLRSGQQAIDERGIQNELSRRQGTQGVLSMVGRGIRSGGVTLANKNAGDSSASEAIARAYGDIGRRELSKVGSQYELENRGIGIDQANLEEQRASGQRKIMDSKNQVINNIVLEARGKLAALDASMLDAELPERLNIEQEKEAIKSQVIQQLQAFDQQLATGAGSVQAKTADQRRAEAAKLAGMGVAPENSFSFTEQVPAEFQNTGPFASELPIFTFPRRRE